MKIIISVFIGGGLGAVLRFLISSGATRYLKGHLPWGTLIANLLGSFLIGFLFILFTRIKAEEELQKLLITGLLGALTTYSTFSLETLQLLRQGQVNAGLLNLALNTAGCLLATWTGIVISKIVLK